LKPLQKLLATTLLLTSVLFVSGCDGQAPNVFWPDIVVSKAPQFSPAEHAVLDELSRTNPELAKKIIARNNELAAAIDAYNKAKREHNRNVLKILKVPDDKIDRIEP
jgi:hypothetical protein